MRHIFLIIGCSGSGKTAITEKLEEMYHLKPIQSYTTRPPRYDGETGHTFVSNEEFDELTDYVAYTEFAGYRYCATSEQVENNDLYVIDPKGVKFFMKSYTGKKTPKIIYINSDLNVRYERMVKRAEENGDDFITAVDKALGRIKTDVVEFYDFTHNKAHVDFVVRNNKNDNLNQIVDRIYDYICDCERR